MPQATQKEDDKGIANSDELGNPTAAKRYIHILHKPCVQGNMPTLPKLSDVS